VTGALGRRSAGAATATVSGARPAGVPVPLALGVLALVTLVKFALVLAAPPELVNNNEERMAAYVLDAIEGGNWTAPRDDIGRLMSKPPLYAWLAALGTLALGGLSRGALYLPSALGTLGCAWAVFGAGRQGFGGDAGLYAALAYLLSGAADKQLVMSRYDGLFAAFVALAALAAWRAWSAGRGWTWFWLAAAGATMTKGPLGILLGALGLLAAAWERATGAPVGLRGSHRAGIALLAAVIGGWLTLAWLAHGRELVDLLLVEELVGHAVGPATPGFGVHRPLGYVLALLLPWSLLTAVGSWRVVARPAAEPSARRFERFVFCWLWVGLLVFVLGAHDRQRLVLPLVPAAALLAGRELAHGLGRLAPGLRARVVAVAVVLWVGGSGVFFHLIRPGTADVTVTVAMRAAARAFQEQVGPGFPLTHVDAPFAFRFYLGQVRGGATPARATELLRGDVAVFVATREAEPLAAAGGPGHVREVWRWPSDGPAAVRVVSNHPRLERPDRLVYVAGPFEIRVDGAQPAETRRREVSFKAAGAGWTVQVLNLAPRPERITVRVAPPGEGAAWTRTLGPEQALRVP